MNKTQKIQAWLRSGDNVSYGALHLMGCSAYTYNVTLAHVDRVNRTAVVNIKAYSTTSSGHRNRLLEALTAEGFEVDFSDGPPKIPSGFEVENG